MKKTLFLAVTALLTLSSAQAQNTLRLMTYNIKNANGMDNVQNFQRVANVINNACPDAVAIQELDSMTNRSGKTYVLGEIAERTQMHAYFAPAIDYDGGKYGIGLLTKQTPIRIQTMALPGREEARTLIMAEFEDYIYCCTHLSLTEEDRMTSLEMIKNFAASAKKPFFLAGDMNAEPQSDFIKGLQKDFQILSNPKVPTFPVSCIQTNLVSLQKAERQKNGLLCWRRNRRSRFNNSTRNASFTKGRCDNLCGLAG